ncbi:MAG: hypothetical protein QGI05_03570, partial [Candidatus Omnitrophota bacterium]|nr:hypothetical protein [Candidatus Omnitrophota bacterium]|tara:strand:+ start:321 stop:569 length:249 start_codon:yes stop_codon:yes gene_type:complete
MQNKVLFLVLGFLCAWIIFSTSSKDVNAASAISSSVAFSGESNILYFLDRAEGKLYKYNIQGRLTKTYIIEELGKDLSYGRK